MIRGIAFDMDGLMFDTEWLAMQAWLAAGEQMGLPVSAELVLKTMGIDENGTKTLLVDHLGPDFDYPLLRRLRLEYVGRHIRDSGMPVKPGLIELLAYLKGNGYRMTMATSTQSALARRYLADAQIDVYFADIVCGDMVEHGKPAPDIYLKAAAVMGIAPAECIALEDSPTGILSAWRAGLKPVMIPDLVEPDEETSQRLYAKLVSLSEVIPLLERMNSDLE